MLYSKLILGVFMKETKIFFKLLIIYKKTMIVQKNCIQMVTIILFFYKIKKNKYVAKKINLIDCLSLLLLFIWSLRIFFGGKKVSLKVSIFAWRLFRNKLSMKTNLFYFEGELFNRMLSCVSAVVVQSNLMAISCFAAFLVMFGSQFVIGWVFIQQTPHPLWTTLFSLVHLQVLKSRGAHLCI